MRAPLQNRALRARILILAVLVSFPLSPLIYPPGGTRANYAQPVKPPIVSTIGDLPKPREMRMEIMAMECKAPYQVLDSTCKLPPPPPPPAPKPVYIPPPKPVYVAPRPVQTAMGGKYDWLAASGIPSSQWSYVDYIITRESGWNPNATNASSGAHGLPQALPYSKTGCGWVDPVCQLRWANSYAISRYGGWSQAMLFWKSSNWW